MGQLEIRQRNAIAEQNPISFPGGVLYSVLFITEVKDIGVLSCSHK